ncbi:hypothetical protein [Burkholderia cepacia]|uniref:hypothetical protein n=1 Tax=Burkholderia cepacia TaxID=292 RepID=UPI002019E441|nr:hypothetical protein [Burkholderia cepacia]UQO37171.1 hypothetical protein L0Z22_31540 [Burkholderia cepacia]UQO51498.1 hypothetical protein L0Z05_37670 [Burkholderia cepacia]UQP05655.1 hypothetical protein L0Z01_14475 [Burkholderia cepacia]
MTLRLSSMLAAAATTWLISGSACAAIDLMPKEITVGKNTTTVEVVNTGDRPEYVTISLARLLNPGVPLSEEKMEQIGDASKPALYAFPAKLSLAPKQTKRIVLKPLREVEVETVYRLDVKPSIKAMRETQAKTVGNIIVNLGFSGLVRQLPEREREDLTVACESFGARLTATGTVRYRVDGAKVNDERLDAFNVYPGVPIPVHGQVVEIPGHQSCRAQ